MSNKTTEGICSSVVKRAIALEQEQRDRYWRTNADVVQLERQLQEFSNSANEHLNPTLVNEKTNIEPMPVLRTALPCVDRDGRRELLCDQTLTIATQDGSRSDAEPVRVAHAVPEDTGNDMALELDMAFTPLTQIGATTLYMQ
ncbi:hypothetical protein DL89DRAFT_265204 [Linderina pennispora]|uniref:Uncharacterized protein n=1 Tax=Linderina pennispora TaxID=61395 RepID=A0A1Y1WHQ0_9FUNG|nr:uncharacterized protein DL89DRAFT_265204 [Linderina pennispora]ORX73043.1 hypothetical protein DL89DRAFT_265204 [Linderina pennispora]